MSDPARSKVSDTRGYVIGYILALALTAAAFAAVRWPSVAGGATLGIVFALAVVQALVHFRFFLHVTADRSKREDLQLILFATLIVVLMVAGTLVILANLRSRMM